MNHDCTCFTTRTTVDVGQKSRTCQIHPDCACGCPRRFHANEGIGECSNLAFRLHGTATEKLNGVSTPRCHGCPEYRPAKYKSFGELTDSDLDRMDSVAILRVAYRELRAHHIEEATVLRARALAFPNIPPVTGHESEAYMRMIQIRNIDIDSVCKPCSGFGTRAYSNTSTWRAGIGGASITTGICDQCWGSGDRAHPWTDLRRLDELTAERVAERAVTALADSCGANFDSTFKSVQQIITHLEALQRKRKVGNEPVDFWMLPLANGLANILRRAIGLPEWDWDKDKPRAENRA